MKIAVDGGALCALPSERYGTYFFSKSILEALQMYDDLNDYYIYTFCDNTSGITFQSNFHYKKLLPKISWMKMRVPMQEKVVKKDVFLALNQAVPTTKSKKICFSHGLSFHFYPHLYKEWYPKLSAQFKQYMKLADYIVVSSQRVKEDILSVIDERENSIIVLPFGIPFDMVEYTKQPRESFFLSVGMNHPIKNIQYVVNMYKRFVKNKDFAHYRLYLVGPFEKYEKEHPGIQAFPICTRDQLRMLYQTATAYLSASLYESFNFPILEALSQRCPVISLEAATIPEMQNYVHLANSEEDYVRFMTNTVATEEHIDYDALQSTFSWKKYVKGLIQLYTR